MPRQKKQHLTRRKDGRYCCKYHGIQFMGTSEDEALRARDEYKEAEREGTLGFNVTVGEYVQRWLPLHKDNVSVKTYNDYAKQLEKLLPVMGHLRLSDASVDDAAKVWTSYKGYSYSTVKRARMLYIALFDSAIENDMCRKNPFRSKFAQPPKAPSGTHRCLTEEEVNLIRTTPHKFQTAAMVMLYAGLRRGEVLALTMDDVDLKKNVIHVGKAIRYDSNQPIVSSPKTEAGVRDVPILSPLKPILGECRGYIAGKEMSERAFRSAWQGYINALECKLNDFTQGKRWYGKTKAHKARMEMAAVLREQGKEEEAKLYDLPAWKTLDIRPHDLRHTYCTMLRDAGVDIKQAMIWLGHADEKMILRIYDHVRENRTKNSVKLVEKSLNGMQNGMQVRK